MCRASKFPFRFDPLTMQNADVLENVSSFDLTTEKKNKKNVFQLVSVPAIIIYFVFDLIRIWSMLVYIFYLFFSSLMSYGYTPFGCWDQKWAPKAIALSFYSRDGTHTFALTPTGQLLFGFSVFLIFSLSALFSPLSVWKCSLHFLLILDRLCHSYPLFSSQPTKKNSQRSWNFHRRIFVPSSREHLLYLPHIQSV